jgi:capsular exopolysaccharide synthesis family protein
MREDQPTVEAPISTYGRTLRRRVWWILGTVVIVAGAALGYSVHETPAYTATATVQVQGSIPTKATSGAAGTGQVAADVEIASSPMLRGLVKNALHLSTAPPLKATAAGTNEDLFSLAAIGPTPTAAALYASTAIAEFENFEKGVYIGAENQLKQGYLAEEAADQTQVGRIDAELKGLGYNPATSKDSGKATTPAVAADLQEITTLEADYDATATALNQTIVNSHAATGGVLEIGAPVAPKTPSSPKTTRNVALGLIVGLILGLILAFVVDGFDDSIKSKEDIERAYPKLPNLGVIPIVDDWKVVNAPYLVTLKAPLSHATEAYRSLRTAVEFARMNRSVRSIVVTSSMDFEGKTSTVANLATTFAKAGQRTLIVSADLRRPRLCNFFACSDEVGLSSIALGIATFDEAIVSVDDVPGLYYLGTGPLPAEAAEFLSSRKVEEIIRSLRDRFDVVLIDTPPAVLVTDAMIIARYVDAVVLVVAQGRTRRRSLTRTRELCLQVDAPVIGTILNGAATKGADSYGYGYGYRYGRYGYGYGQSRTYGSDQVPTNSRAAKRHAKAGSAKPAAAVSPASLTPAALDAESEQTGS